MTPEDYGITIKRGEFEGEVCFEARVRELPDLVEYADTADEAYALALDAIETTAEIFAEKGRKMPEPMVVPEDYSGRVTLRVPKSLHASLSKRAEMEGVSLNQLMVSVLSAYRGFEAMSETNGDWHSIDLSSGCSNEESSPGRTSAQVIPIQDYRDSSGW